jgi:chaperonin GroES
MIRPILDHIVVREIKSEQITSSGIVLAGTEDKPIKGEVLAVGPGSYSDKEEFIVPGVSTGDHIIFIYGSGETVNVNNQEFKILKESDILAIIK